MVPAFYISIPGLEEIDLFGISGLMTEESIPFGPEFLVYPSWYRFYQNLFDHRQICRPTGKELAFVLEHIFACMKGKWDTATEGNDVSNFKPHNLKMYLKKKNR